MRPSTLRVVLGLAMAVVALAFGPERELAAGKPPRGPGSGYAVGDIAVSFTAPDQFGNEVSLRDYSGSFVLLDFSAVWCAPSNVFARDTQPQIARDMSARGIPFTTITILLDGQTEGVPSTLRNAQNWANAYRISTPVVSVDGDANSPLYAQFAAYSDPLAPPAGAFPTFVALGPDQRILAIQVGLNPDKPGLLESPFIDSVTLNPYYEFVVLQNTLYNLGILGSALDVLSPEMSELGEWIAKGKAKKARASLDSVLSTVEDLAAELLLTVEQASRLESLANTLLDTLGG